MLVGIKCVNELHVALPEVSYSYGQQRNLAQLFVYLVAACNRLQ